MNDRVALFLPGASGRPWRWVSVRDGAVAARGEGLPAAEEDTDYVAVAPADAVTLHWAELPDRSSAQSAAAARLLVAEASIGPSDGLHVAVGREADRAERPIGVVARGQMATWLGDLAGAGIEPVAIIPAPMLLPRPDQGYVVGDLGDGERIYRGDMSGFVEEDGLTTLIVGDSPVAHLDREDLEASIATAVTDPPLDLRQGAFALRKPLAIDWQLVRRLVWLLVAIVSATLLITLVQIVRYNVSADTLEAKADTLARSGLPPGETINDASSQLSDRLARMRGGGAGFSQTAAAVAAAVGAVQGSEITGMTFDAQGKMRVSVTTQTQGQIKDLRDRIVAAGFAVDPGVFSGSGGKFQGAFTVSVR